MVPETELQQNCLIGDAVVLQICMGQSQASAYGFDGHLCLEAEKMLVTSPWALGLVLPPLHSLLRWALQAALESVHAAALLHGVLQQGVGRHVQWVNEGPSPHI